jgi:hypothetical protein
MSMMVVYGMAFDFFNISGSLLKKQIVKIRSSAQGLFMDDDKCYWSNTCWQSWRTVKAILL